MANIYIIQDIEEIDKILKKLEKWTLVLRLKYLRTKVEIILKNLLLGLLSHLWFNQKTPKKEEIRNIVVYSVGILGDNVVRLPAIASLKHTYPNAKLIVINKYQNWNPEVPKQLFENTDYIDEIILVKNNPIQRRGIKFSYDSSLTKHITCDLFINLSPLGARGWFGAVVREMIFAKKLGAKYAGSFKVYSILNPKKIKPILHRIAHINYPRLPEKVLKKFHIDVNYNLQILSKNLVIQNTVNLKLNKSHLNTEYVILHPGSALPCQRWPILRYAEIANYLYKKYKLKSIVTGVTDEKELVNKLIKYAPKSAINFAEKTSLAETIELVKKAKIVISNDTGLLHLATIQNTPTIGVFGTRENPTWWFPLGKKKYILLSFSKDSLRYNDENIITDLLQIQTNDVKKTIDKMLFELNKGL